MEEYRMNEGRHSGYHFIFSKRSTGEILLEGDVTGGNKQDCTNAANTKARSAGLKPFVDEDLKLYMKRIEIVEHKITILDVMSRYGMNRTAIAKRFGIPYQTVQKWCFPKDNPNHRECPEYIIKMIDEILSKEK